MRIALEGSGVGIEGAGAVELSDLTEMAEIVIGEFMKHLRESDGAHFVMLAGARASGRGDGVEVGEEGAAKCNELFQVPCGRFLMHFFLRVGHEFGDFWRVFEHDEFGTLLVESFDNGQVRENFGDRPTVRRGLPGEKVFRQVSE